MKAKLEEVGKLKDKAELLVSQVNDTTRDIKYMDMPSNISITVQGLAEENGIDVEYEVDQIRSAINSLESAIYNLVEPFEDKVRDLETEYDDLEWDIEEAGEDRAA